NSEALERRRMARLQHDLRPFDRVGLEIVHLLDSVPATSNHPGGVNVTMADGHVHSIKNTISRPIWWALSTKANGEVGNERPKETHPERGKGPHLDLSR